MPHQRNRLSAATSPYLLQHADNPVHWFEWGPEAFAEATRRDVPVLLSVGYASCHWCHVMAHESFEDDATARTMNELFVNIKVDREERPDIDRVYMEAVQAMSGGHGGWPMTVFLTPDARPFFAGTYFPPLDRPGHPSFRRVLHSVDEAWRTRRADLERQAGSLTQAIATPASAVDRLEQGLLTDAYSQIVRMADRTDGGFGGAPKFPQAPLLDFLLRTAGRSWAPEAGDLLHGALSAMARGGIHDVLGGGFARYSVDGRWRVPHFEKMLYDNAQLGRLYALAAGVTRDPQLADVAGTTFDYLMRDLALPDGGFASGEDADSEGEEGRFYVFTWDQLQLVSSDPAVATVLGVTPEGDFEGANIVRFARPVEAVAAEFGSDPDDLRTRVARVLDELRRARSGRVRPTLDDKVVCAWNGLAIRALAEAGRVLGRPAWVDAAARAGHFVLNEMRDPTGRVMRSWRDGRTSGPGFCDDYGSLALGLFALYATTADPFWYHRAAEITRQMIDLFWDEEEGGFHPTGRDVEHLIARPKNLFDSPTPSDNALAAEALQHLVAYTADPELRTMLDRTLRVAGSIMRRHPLGAGSALGVLLVETDGPREVAIVGPVAERRVLEQTLDRIYRPAVFRASGDGVSDHGVPLLADRPAIDGTAAAYVCRDFVCAAPVTTPDELVRALD